MISSLNNPEQIPTNKEDTETLEVALTSIQKVTEEEECPSNLVECPVCFEEYDQDEVVLCKRGHTAICGICYSQLKSNNCPLCREYLGFIPPLIPNFVFYGIKYYLGIHFIDRSDRPPLYTDENHHTPVNSALVVYTQNSLPIIFSLLYSTNQYLVYGESIESKIKIRKNKTSFHDLFEGQRRRHVKYQSWCIKIKKKNCFIRFITKWEVENAGFIKPYHGARGITPFLEIW
jgi:hypothetical protein